MSGKEAGKRAMEVAGNGSGESGINDQALHQWRGIYQFAT
jgi:hypothetical protein